MKGLKYILGLIILMFFAIELAGQNADVFIGGTSLHIDGIMCLQGSLYNESVDEVRMPGEMCFINSGENEIEFGNASTIGGLFSFKGNNNTYLSIPSLTVENILVDITDGNLLLNGELRINESLHLLKAKILTETGGEIIIDNDSESSLICSTNKENQSYLAVGLTRAVQPGSTYTFPVGTDNSYHPILLSGFSDSDHLKVSYTKDLDEAWKTGSGNDEVVFPFSGGWLLEDDGFDVKFTASASMLDDNAEIITDDLAGFFLSNPHDYREEPIIDDNLTLSNDFYLKGSSDINSGYYSLIELGSNGPDVRDTNMNLVNTLIVGQTGPTNFIIENLDEYNYVKIKFYDTWGRLIFNSDKYQNDMDARNYPDGTYYYNLEAELKETEEIIIKNDVVEVIRVQ